MKKQKKPFNKLTKEDFNITIEVKQEIKVSTVIYNIIERMGIKKFTTLIGYICGREGLSHVSFPANMLATEKDVDTVEGMFIYKYVIDNWKKILKDATKYWKKKVIKNKNEK